MLSAGTVGEVGARIHTPNKLVFSVADGGMDAIATDIAAARNAACFINSAQQVYCVGLRDYAGVAGTSNAETPKPVVSLDAAFATEKNSSRSKEAIRPCAG